MIKPIENEPALLLRVIASVMLDPYRERLLPKMADSQRQSGPDPVKRGISIPSEF